MENLIVLAFFFGVFGLCLGYFGVVCGLKKREAFFGEIICRFLGFWIERKNGRGFVLLLGDNKGESRRRHSNQHIARMKNLKQQFHHKM